MEIIFSYISGLGSPIEEFALVLNKKTGLYFKKKSYSHTIEKIMLIFVTQNLNDIEKSKCKIKYTKVNDSLAINIYLDNRTFLEKNFINRIAYAGSVISESLVRNKKLNKLDIDIKTLIEDLEIFFLSVVSAVR